MNEYDFLSAFDEDDDARADERGGRGRHDGARAGQRDRTRAGKHGRARVGELDSFLADEEVGAFDGKDRGERESFVQRIHLPEALIALAITALLAIVPLIAHATTDEVAATSSNAASSEQSNAAETEQSNAAESEGAAAQGAQGSESAEGSQGAQGSQAASSGSSSAAKKSADGLTAKKSKTIFAYGRTITTSESGARGIVAAGKGAVVAGDLTVTTKGDDAPAIETAENAQVSVVNTALKTAGSNSSLVRATGTVELENVNGKAAASPVAFLCNAAALIVSNSTLTSDFEGIAGEGTLIEGITNAVTSGTTDAVSGAVVIYGTDGNSGATTLFQATGSTLVSGIRSGALFYLTNSQSKIVLSNVELEFDSESANLLTAAGNNVNGWGKAGKNGATSTFTSYGNHLAGNVAVDTTSSVDFYLLEGSSWKGTSAINSTTTGETAAVNLTVNIDSTSAWTLTGKSTVSNLNLETGGKLVDENGDAVKIVDKDGNTLVDGASDVEVKVTGNFTTTVTTTSANQLEGSTVDRGGYDEKYSESTSFGTNGEATSPSVEDEARERAEYIKAWFVNL